MSELATLVDTWRRTRSPRAAALIELLSDSLPEPEDPPAGGRSKAAHQAWIARAEEDRADDVPILLASLTGGTSRQGIERLAAIGDDPRLATGLVALLDQPPFSSRSTQPFWRALLARLAALADLRQVDVLTELGAHYGQNMTGSVGQWLGNQVAKTAAALADRDQEWSALEGDALTFVEALEATHRAALRSRARAKQDACRTEASEDAMIAAVRADPLAKGPRLIYIDWLLERGDPLGEVLAAERAGGPTLDEDQGRRTLGDLAAVASDARFELGFPTSIGLWIDKSLIPKSVGRPEWATVSELRVSEWARTDPRTQRALHRLASHEVMRSLSAIVGPDPAIMAALIDGWGPARSAAIVQWGVRGVLRQPELDALGPVLDQLPGLHGLDLSHVFAALPEPLLARFERLESLMLGGDLPILDLLERLDARPLAQLWWEPDGPGRPALFTRGRDGRLSRLAIAIVETYPRSQPYPTESVLDLLTAIEPWPLERLEQVPLRRHRPLFSRRSSRRDHAPPPEAIEAIQEALAGLPGAPTFELGALADVTR